MVVRIDKVVWLDKRKEGKRRARARAMAATQALAAAVDRVPTFRVRLFPDVGVAPDLIRTIFDHIKKLAIRTLRQRQTFRLHSIAVIRPCSCKAKLASTQEIHEHVFKTKPLPATEES